MNKVVTSVIVGCLALGLTACGDNDNNTGAGGAGGANGAAGAGTGTQAQNTGTSGLLNNGSYYRNNGYGNTNGFGTGGNMNGIRGNDPYNTGFGVHPRIFIDLDNDGQNDLGRLGDGIDQDNGLPGQGPLENRGIDANPNNVGPMNTDDRTLTAPGTTGTGATGTGAVGTGAAGTPTGATGAGT